MLCVFYHIVNSWHQNIFHIHRVIGLFLRDKMITGGCPYTIPVLQSRANSSINLYKLFNKQSNTPLIRYSKCSEGAGHIMNALRNLISIRWKVGTEMLWLPKRKNLPIHLYIRFKCRYILFFVQHMVLYFSLDVVLALATEAWWNWRVCNIFLELVFEQFYFRYARRIP